MANPEARAREVTLLDINNDGLIDFVQGSLADGQREVEAPPTIFVQNPDGTFTDAGEDLGYTYNEGYGLEYAVLADLDNDGQMELIQKQPFQVFDTSGETLTDITDSIFNDLFPENQRGLTDLAVEDFNGDTIPDFFFPSWTTDRHQLVLSGPDGWNDASAASGIASVNFRTTDGAGVATGDFDNDADIDMIVLDRRTGGTDYLLSNDGCLLYTSPSPRDS